jgi:uncharacterized LabA/DUF88 family protein
MEPLRTVMFIDGRNLKYNLAAFQFHSLGQEESEVERPYRLDEKHFLWQEFFLGVIKKFNTATGHEYRLIRTYWYNAEKIRPFEINKRQIEAILEANHDKFPDLTENEVIKLGQQWYEKERAIFERAKEQIYEGIQRKVAFLEFKYTGEYVVSPFKTYRLEKQPDGSYLYQGTREGEKGVDVGIAVDMIAKMNSFDVAILISGDADFIPLVCYVKDALKNVYQFSLAQGIPPAISYLSPWLRGQVDVFQYYDELELLETYLNRNSGIPPTILRVINERIDFLRTKAKEYQSRLALK